MAQSMIAGIPSVIYLCFSWYKMPAVLTSLDSFGGEQGL